MKLNKSFRGKKFRKLFIICVSVVLVAMQMLPMMAFADAPVIGTFTAKAAPTFNDGAGGEGLIIKTVDAFATVNGEADLADGPSAALDYHGGSKINLTVDTQLVVVDAETITINGKVYSFVADGAASADGEIEIGTDLATGQAAIVAAINGTDGVNTPHPTVTASDFDTNISIITAITEGAVGDSITTVTDMAGGANAFAGGTLAGGSIIADLVFVLNGTTITLNGDAGDYPTDDDVAANIQATLDADSNTTVSVAGGTDQLVLSGAANENIVYATAVTGDLADIGLDVAVGTTTAATGVATTLTPGLEYNLEVDITEPDGIGTGNGGLDQIEVKLWFDATGASDNEGFFGLQTVPETKTYANIIWDADTNLATLSAGAGTSWALTTSTLPSAGQMADPTYITHRFVFQVKLGEISSETPGAEEWQVGAKVTDKDAATDYEKLEATNGVGGNGLPMNWYGSIALPGGTTADWGRIDAGLVKTAATAELEITGIDLVANGVYDYGVKADTIWTGSGGTNNATRSVGAAGANEFALFSDTATGQGASAANLTADLVEIDIEEDLAASLTNTPLTKSNYLYLAVNSDFYQGEEFEGTITYVIHDDN